VLFLEILFSELAPSAQVIKYMDMSDIGISDVA
jgi:hypothetical protein